MIPGKRSLAVIAVLASLAISSPTYALSQAGQSVTLVGTEFNGARVYVGIWPNPNNCLYSGVYFTNTAELSRTLAVAVAAKLSGRTVRVDYSQGSDAYCAGYGIYVE